MTSKEIDKLTIKECKSIIKDFYKNPAINMYFSLVKQLDSISSQIEDLSIDVDDEEDGDKIDILFKWAEKGAKFYDTVKTLQKGIDLKTLREEKEKRLGAKTASPEFYAKQRSKKNNAKTN